MRPFYKLRWKCWDTVVNQTKIPAHRPLGSNGPGANPWLSLRSVTHPPGGVLPAWGGEAPSALPAPCWHLLEAEATTVLPLLVITDPFYYFILFLFFAFFRATPAAYGSSQARGQIRAITVSLRHSYSNSGSEPHLQSTPQLTATPDSQPTERGQGLNPQPHGY